MPLFTPSSMQPQLLIMTRGDASMSSNVLQKAARKKYVVIWTKVMQNQQATCESMKSNAGGLKQLGLQTR